MPAVHISDLMTLYALLLERILRKQPLPSGEEGYYFAAAHMYRWWDVLGRLAAVLHARGLVNEPSVQIWQSDEMAQEALGGMPIDFMHMIWIRRMYSPSVGYRCWADGECRTPINSVKAYEFGWQPVWDERRFLENMEDEVEAVQELDRVRSSIFDSLNPAGRG